MSRRRRYFFTSAYALLVLMGAFILGCAIEGQAVLDRIEREIGVAWDDIDPMRYHWQADEKYYNRQVYLFYTADADATDRADMVLAAQGRSFRAGIVYLAPFLLLPLWYLLMVPATVGMWWVAYPAQKTKQTRTLMRGLFWSGIIVALSLPLCLPALNVLSTIME